MYRLRYWIWHSNGSLCVTDNDAHNAYYITLHRKSTRRKMKGRFVGWRDTHIVSSRDVIVILMFQCQDKLNQHLTWKINNTTIPQELFNFRTKIFMVKLKYISFFTFSNCSVLIPRIGFLIHIVPLYSHGFSLLFFLIKTMY
jgi:hypothetical protein